jgi:16S rRNA processing protein RimM
MTDSGSGSGKLHAGTIGGAYGIKGWVRVHALTDPPENFLAFHAWYVTRKGDARVFDTLRFEDGRRHGKGLIAKIEGVDDRTAAERLQGTEVWVDADDLEPLDEGDFYWHQLVGLEVWSTVPAAPGDATRPGKGKGEGEGAGDRGRARDQADGPSAPVLLGVVDHLLETGANDVLVIAPCPGSIDKRERLAPYLPGDVVHGVDLRTGRIDVNWHPDD